ncbi:transposase [Allonocardiopsis opalescens]|nr:transposase [Allonocardiopsis opalescens]
MWEMARALMPPAPRRPQGGGRAAADERLVLTSIIYVLTSGCAWQQLPPHFGVTVPTAHRWYLRWTRADLWNRLRDAAAAPDAPPGLAEWTCAIAEAAATRLYATPTEAADGDPDCADPQTPPSAEPDPHAQPAS